MGLRRATTNLGSHRLKPVPQGRKYCRAQATGEDHRLKPVPQVRIESSVGVFFGICVPQAHRDRLGILPGAQSSAFIFSSMPNRLALEKSPYLLQHANNPVDWLPWGEEAFEKARREDKPVFLS